MEEAREKEGHCYEVVQSCHETVQSMQQSMQSMQKSMQSMQQSCHETVQSTQHSMQKSCHETLQIIQKGRLPDIAGSLVQPPTEPRDVVSAYLADEPELASRLGEVDDELVAHFQKLTQQLFGQPALV